MSSRPPRPRRTIPQMLLTVAGFGVSTIAIIAAVVLWQLQGTASSITRIELGETTLDVPRGPADEEGSGDQVAWENFLLVGADSSEGLDADSSVVQGREDLDTIRSDTMIVLHLDYRGDVPTASFLSLPRDLAVQLPDQGYTDRLNAALPLQGGAYLVRTIEENLDIPIDHYVQVDFNGFLSIVDQLGGVELDFPAPARDIPSGFFNDELGCVSLDQDQALAFVRSRRMEFFNGIDWVRDNQSDLQRIERQQLFLLAAAQKAANQGLRDPFAVNGFLQATTDAVVLDGALTLRELEDLANTLRLTSVNDLEFVTLNDFLFDEVVNGDARLGLRQDPALDVLLAPFRIGEPLAPVETPPADPAPDVAAPAEPTPEAIEDPAPAPTPVPEAPAPEGREVDDIRACT